MGQISLDDMDYNDENCSNNYIPSTEEYLGALGLYGKWLTILGGLFTLLLYVVFFEQVFFSQRGAHRVFRGHIYWIASVYPFMTMMSLASVVVPRAHNICSAVKVTSSTFLKHGSMLPFHPHVNQARWAQVVPKVVPDTTISGCYQTYEDRQVHINILLSALAWLLRGCLL
ncbi:hypothetical protein SK128_000941 [Halocaridina rubra]|uniref:Uncharacterized protein n=1 Tax=Halocaridina rubra TaxID=373956 RepID=A0AAN8X6G8_HALRR